MPKISTRTYRHTFCTVLAQRGVLMQDIAAMVGHSTTYITERYAHLAPDAGSDAIDLLGSVMPLSVAAS